MQIELIVLGNLKEKYWVDAVKEYCKRLQRFVKLTVTELKEVALPDKASDANIEQVLTKEAEMVLKKISASDHVIALAINGKMHTSEELAQKIDALKGRGQKIVFIIGSSHGLSDMIYSRAQEQISFSKMTFPHQFARVMLLEQLYRACKINANEAYHK